ncbi:MAG TPA: serine hydrolase domain-containing protein [Gemmatimonadales bacterium]|nr:serine hydrolase domain-containing protein [Gemmatimonadales bacterium]
MTAQNLRRAILGNPFVLTFLGVTSLAGQNREQRADQFAPVRAVIRQVMDSTGAPAIAVAVAQHGRIIWEEGFGWADRERRIPATQHTMFSLASISKPITATGLMRLVEEGKVELDAPANRYLGLGTLTGLAGEDDGATVRRVLSHTAGLPLHYRFYYADLDYREPTMDETIARYGVLVYPPGVVYEYSNLGYGIIDHIIERVSGLSYPDYMRTRVFAPLGLTRTSVHIGPGLEPYVAQRYDSRLRPIPYYDFDHDGGSAVYASAHDLVRFGMFHLKERLADQQRILLDSTIDLMQRSQTPTSSGVQYGLGWRSLDEFGWTRVNHTGGMPGVATILALYPSERTAAVVLANKAATPVERVLQEILSVVFPPRYADSLRSRRARPPHLPSSPALAPPPDWLGEWSGTVRTWARTLPFKLTVQAGGDIHVRLANQLPALLADARFSDGLLVGRFAGTIPTPDVERHPHSVLLQLRLFDGTLKGQATAQTTDEPVYFAVTAYVELRK